MKNLLKAMFLVGILAACQQTTTTPPSTGAPVKAATGGVIEVGGAKLSIPAGALNQDANVTVSVNPEPSEPKDNPLQAAGPSVSLDLGGASLGQAATLELPTAVGNQDGSLVVLENDPKAPADEPSLRVHAATTVAGAALSKQGLPSKIAYKVTRASAYTAYLVPQPKPTEVIGGVSMQVPFYWQDGIPWCVPTSLAMTLNAYKPQPSIASNPKFPGGFASNFGLASLIKQSANSGASVVDILKAANIPSSAYNMMVWDAELTASTSGTNGNYSAFQSYVILATTGIFGLFPAKPVWTSSDRLWHAFVLTGLTNSDGVYINDSNNRWAGTHPSNTWKQFYDANCSLKDKNDPSKGCADNGDTHPDLYTLIFNADPKPETERRGSIELSRSNSSVQFSNPSSNIISRWNWEGAYPNGYYFTDEASLNNQFPFGYNLTQDTEFKFLIPRSSLMEANFNVVNATNVALEYEVESRLYINNSSKAQKFNTINVPAYSLGNINLNFGNLADLGPIGGPTPARLEINLRQNGVVQDVKNVAFKLGPDPTDLPKVRILVPSNPTTLLKGEPFLFKGEGFDAHSLPNGRARLSWYDGASKLGDGGEYSLVPAAAGTRTLSLVATGEYGTKATASVSVNVIDPTRTPGEIVIVEPTNGKTFWSDTTNDPKVSVPLVGYATYSNGAAVPGNRLVWTANGTEVGRGSSLTPTLIGGRNGAAYTITMTVLSDTGVAIGSKSVNITVGYTYIG